MTNAYVLITALPPTKGHRELITFAAYLADNVEVILCTQPSEPFTQERYDSVKDMCKGFSNVHLNRIHQELPQEPEDDPGFWDMWAGFLRMFGFEPGDTVVASESYGKALADVVEGVFMPFDVERSLSPYKATRVRDMPYVYFDWIDETFQSNIVQTITVFGAESTGKTTLAKALAKQYNGHFLFEYARPYLEQTVNEITERSMTAIWKGQKALQDYGLNLKNKPFVIQDTDLWSTVGYWEMAPWTNIGKVPDELNWDAWERTSDLYVITQSNIAFEPDPLRYGGDTREISDAQWVDFCERYALPYVVLNADKLSERVFEASDHMYSVFRETAEPLTEYTRRGSEYK